MSLFVKASPNEFLVVGRRGRLANRGLAGSAIPWPGSSFARVASSEQEATFAMTQETSDGIFINPKSQIPMTNIQFPDKAGSPLRCNRLSLSGSGLIKLLTRRWD